MGTVELTLYRLAELSEDTQEAVVTRWREHDEFPWTHDYRASLYAFCEAMGLTTTDWSVSQWEHSYVRWEEKSDAEDPDRKWDPEECTVDLSGTHGLTGFCADESLLDGIRKAATGATFKDVMDACFDAWIRDYLSDIAYWESEESVREDIESEDYWFTKTGGFPPGHTRHVSSADALLDLMDQLTTAGIAIPGQNAGQRAGTEGLDFTKAWGAIAERMAHRLQGTEPKPTP